MHECELDLPAVIEFDEFVGALHALKVGMDACECHGALVGALLTSRWTNDGFPEVFTAHRWIESVLEDASAGLHSDDADVREDWALEVMRETWVRTVQAVSSSEFTFEPVLPPDARPIGQRARGVGAWCAGFLSGLGQGGELGQEMSADVREVIADVSDITRIEPSPDESEESERAIAEVIEFLRAGVMLIEAELGFVVRSRSPNEAKLH